MSRRHILRYDGIRPDDHVIANFDIAEHAGACAYKDTVADNGGFPALNSLPKSPISDGHVLKDNRVPLEHRLPIDHHP